MRRLVKQKVKKDKVTGMARIRSKNTHPELVVRKFLFSRGLRYRLHVAGLPGKPDMVLKKYNAVIFINGCFWHAHEGCRYKKIPRNNAAFWEEKISGNVMRDKINESALIKSGWRVYIVWECELQKTTMNATLYKLLADILNSAEDAMAVNKNAARE